MEHWVLDDKNKAVKADTYTWGLFFENSKRRRVADDDIKGKNRLAWALGLKPDYWVSTVFLGLDHSYGTGPPLLFETMVFPRWPAWKRWLSDPGASAFTLNNKPKWWVRPFVRKLTLGDHHIWLSRFQGWSENSELDCARYTAWDEAAEGHKKMVERWRKRF